jgi:Sushi repeat (SCR repeat)
VLVGILTVRLTSGNHCGWPPIPLHADVSTEVVPGKTTNVTYKCNDPFVLDPNGPQFSTCDQLTGHWTDLPICVSADPLVPADARIARTELSYKPTVHDYFVIESNGTQFYDGDQVTEHWTELPNFNCSDPPVPANAQIVDRAEFNVTYKCNDPLVIDPNGPQFSTCDQLTGLWTDLPICVCADPPVPANTQIVSRTDFSVLFQCDAPFPFKGNYTVVCDESGNWDQLPSCNHRSFPYTLNMFHI